MKFARVFSNSLFARMAIIGLIFGISLISVVACSTSPSEQWTSDGVIKAGEYPNAQKYGDYEIFWKNDDQYLYVGMKAKTNGWVAVGFGSTMKNTDMCFGFVKGGNAALFDLFSSRANPLPPDTDQGGKSDILAFGGKEEGGFTTIEFKRALVTGDKLDTQLVKGVNKIIWAYGPDDTTGSKHIARGYGEITIK